MKVSVPDVSEPSSSLSLVCRVAGRLCALPIVHVEETMRPQPIDPVAGAPRFVRGVSLVRGAPLAVVDASALLGGEGGPATRLVVVRVGEVRVGLLVDEVVGVRRISSELMDGLPPLLSDAAAEVISRLGTLDGELLVVLESARLVAAVEATS